VLLVEENGSPGRGAARGARKQQTASAAGVPGKVVSRSAVSCYVSFVVMAGPAAGRVPAIQPRGFDTRRGMAATSTAMTSAETLTMPLGFLPVIAAKAGIQAHVAESMDPGFRRGDHGRLLAALATRRG
jgi:hypothetical protein